MIRVLRRFAACRIGSATVEAAAVVPVLLTLGLGAAEGGNLVIENHKTKVGLAAGARLLARARSPESVEAEARNLAVTGARSGGAPRIHGWTAAQVQVSYRWVDNADGDYTGGDEIRIVRLTTSRPYAGLGLLRLTGWAWVHGEHEERWTGG